MTPTCVPRRDRSRSRRAAAPAGTAPPSARRSTDKLQQVQELAQLVLLDRPALQSSDVTGLRSTFVTSRRPVQWLAGEREEGLAHPLGQRRGGGLFAATSAGTASEANGEHRFGDQIRDARADHVHAEGRALLVRPGDYLHAALADDVRLPHRAAPAHADARIAFRERLAGVTDPERKRSIIGEEFIRVFEEEAAKLEGARFLVQGTLYSDVIESGGGASNGAAKIKSHHNVGGLPSRLDFELIEPLRQLFKDEVRAVAAELGLPERLVWRQPFPGPGLAIRVIGGEVTKNASTILREADAILQDEIRAAGLYRDLWQSFCVLPAVRSVGVQGDERTYAYPIVIRAVTSDDAMTADWARLPYELLETVSSRIINEIPPRQPRRARHLLEATEHDRVGVGGAGRGAPVARARSTLVEVVALRCGRPARGGRKCGGLAN